MSDSDTPAVNLWYFCIELYARPGVADACLQLQDDHRVDVPLLLFLLWHARDRHALDELSVRSVTRAASEWQQTVVTTLRHLRRRLKQPIAPVDANEANAFREEIKRMELRAERLQLNALAQMQTAHELAVSAMDASRHNVAMYAAALDRVLPANLVERVTKYLN